MVVVQVAAAARIQSLAPELPFPYALDAAKKKKENKPKNPNKNKLTSNLLGAPRGGGNLSSAHTLLAQGPLPSLLLQPLQAPTKICDTNKTS